MKETPFEYVGKTLMNLFLVYEKDPKYKSLMTELNLELSLQLLLAPIVDPKGPQASYMIDAYRKLSRVVQLDKLNKIGYSPDFDSLYWQDETETTGPKCGNCGAQTKPILYGMPDENSTTSDLKSVAVSLVKAIRYGYVESVDGKFKCWILILCYFPKFGTFKGI